MENFPLNPKQQKAFDCIEGSTKNLFITGRPGTGKSILINALVSSGRKYYTLAAPTGLAALNIGGRTLHSIFRIPSSSGILDSTYKNYPTDENIIKMIKYNIKHLIIDEISMVRVDVFDYIEGLLRFAKGNDLPFGGIQVILVGDFYQLPPVCQGFESIQLREAGYRSPFVFASKAFKENFETIELKEVMRQKGDAVFIRLLQSARTGNLNDTQEKLLNKRFFKDSSSIEYAITLCGSNKQADEINISHLNKIDSPVQIFRAQEYGTWPAFPCDPLLKIKIGAYVMVKQNRADIPMEDKADSKKESLVVNGTIGTVIEMSDRNNANSDSEWVKIRLQDYTETTIYRQRFERRVKEKIFEKWEERVVASFEQVPLQLAWAISMHKSQGQTFERAFIDPRKIFAAGQLYVALSRVKNLNGVFLTEKINKRKFFANIHVREFFKNLDQ